LSESSIVADTAARIFADLADPQTINAAKTEAWKAPLWSALEEAGLTLAWVPDDLGGAGAGLADGFEVLRVAGQYAAPVAIAETLLAGWLLAQARITSPAGPMTIAPVRPKDRISLNADGTLSGRARGIPFAREAQHVAVLAHDDKGTSIALVAKADVRVSDGKSLSGEPVGDVTFDRSLPIAVDPAPAGIDQSALMQMGAVARAVQSAGALDAILSLSVKYAGERVAFEKPIAKFQAVQHNLARLAGEASAAMTAATSAADAIANAASFDAGVYLEAASARIRSAEAASEGAAIAHQVHGAIGYTKEHILHRFTLRLLAWRDDFGNESQWAVDLGNRIAKAGADELWPLIASR
jgi:alkylation response protein AidB-like acyl-CoA dehydrogenase